MRVFCATDTQLLTFAESVVTTDDKLDDLWKKIEDSLSDENREDRLLKALQFEDPMKRESKRFLESFGNFRVSCLHGYDV